jgi:hypothetical protein
MFTTFSPEGKVVLYDRATGQRLERWPVDARELLATGGFTADTPIPEAPTPHAAPVTPVVERPFDGPLPLSDDMTPTRRRRGKVA